MLLPPPPHTHSRDGQGCSWHLQHRGHSVLNAFGVGEAWSCALLEAQPCAWRWHEAL